MDDSIKPIGTDTIKVYGFRFGMYRYQVEHFDHNKSTKNESDKTIIELIDFWDSIHGTRVYRFLDWDCNFCISSAIFFNEYVDEDGLKQMVLSDSIDWKEEDPYDFKDLFFEDSEHEGYFSFPREKGKVEHNYPECEDPYEKCPICGGELDESVIEVEYANDIFNSRGGYGPEGDAWGEWDEVHRCPHCGKLFYIHAEA